MWAHGCPRGGAPPIDGVRLVAANVAGQEYELEGALNDLRQERADILVLSELTRRAWLELRPSYEHSVFAENGTSVGVYARWPLTRVEDAPEVVLRFGVAVEVAAPSGTFVVYALHLPRPWPSTSRSNDTSLGEHRALIDELIEAVRAETRPVVIAGDLNLSDRTGGFRALTGELKDAMRTNWTAHSSIRWAILLLRIDHIFVPSNWCADQSRRFAIGGSDHYGVSSVIGRCASSVVEVTD